MSPDAALAFDPARTNLVSEARETIRRGSKSFHMASHIFDRRTRERAWLLYAWCRHCDDEADGQSHGHGQDAARIGSVERLQALTQAALIGQHTGEPPFDGLALVARECGIPHRYIFDHLEGFALDAAGWRPTSEADLVRYCYHVAGAVGCMMAVVMGVDPAHEETLDRASDLGIAFQLANIARDVREDDEAGRCYLPTELIARFGLDEDRLLEPDQRPQLVALTQHLVALADRYEASSRAGVPRLPFRARWAVLAAGRIYGAIGHRVAALGEAAWDDRVVVRRREKLAFLIPSLIESARARQGS